MSWDVENTDEFGSWFVDLSETDQDAIDFTVDLLIARGPNLRFPHSSGIGNSRHSHMRELRIQSEGRPLRVFYAFDPRRSAILLIGGDKTGDDRFYERLLPVADELYDVHLKELKQEGLLK
ncbi:MAG TPA: type II toxin-antitoxin system RelE/ParE family toxin [Caulobacteraceae bacterium]|nr:type II toxin-antitoxin system RelE/ParE family toxin [Caulobacteraceae bacterium]